LPRERAKLYEHATKVLCHHWDLTGHKIAVEETPADFMWEDDKLELLRKIAWRMQAGEKGLQGNFILSNDLHDEIAGYLRTRWQLSAVDVGRISHAMVNQLQERNFILCLYGAQVYGFVHRTFLEYFCAAEIFDRLQPGAVQGLSPQEIKENIFRAHYKDSAWHEVLRLICGMVKPLLAGELINAILPKREEAFVKTDDLILAVQCLAEVADLNQIADVAERVLEGLFGWFERTKKVQFALTSEKEMDFKNKAIPAIEVIGKNWPRREKFISWISKSHKKVAGLDLDGFQALGKMVTALWSDHQRAREELVTLAQTKGFYSVVNLSLEALLRSQKDAKSLLQKIAVGDDHEESRYNAINILVRYHSKAFDTKLLLRQVATNDTSYFVRRTAIKHLVKYNSEASDTLSLLRKVVADDPDESNRKFFVGILAKGYNEIWKKLLTEDFDGRWLWLDSKALIDEKRVEDAAKVLKLPPATIRQHYEDIAKEIPLRLAWKEGCV